MKSKTEEKPEAKLKKREVSRDGRIPSLSGASRKRAPEPVQTYGRLKRGAITAKV